jgi:hypothetical protein
VCAPQATVVKASGDRGHVSSPTGCSQRPGRSVLIRSQMQRGLVSNESQAVTLGEWLGLGPDGFVHPMGLWKWCPSNRIILLPLG